MTTLIYDKDTDGHHLNFLRMLANYLQKQPAHESERVVFVVNPIAHSLFNNFPNIRVHYIDSLQIQRIDNERSVLKKAAIQFDYLQTLAKQYEAKRVIFMHFDAFQIEVGKPKNWSCEFEILGILFNPYRAVYEDESTPKLKFKKALKSSRKYLQMRWLLQNKNVTRLFILNDQKAVEEHNQRYRKVFDLLTDPVDMSYVVAEPKTVLRERHGIDSNKFVALIFGNISPRKNVENILKSLSHLSQSQQKNLVLILAGMPESSYKSTLYGLIEETKKLFPEIIFIEKYKFLETVEAEELLALSDTVLIPYLNFFNSSGVIGLAAKYNVPLIASRFGVMNDIVTRYRLGTITSPTASVEIAQRIVEQMVRTMVVDGKVFLAASSEDSYCRSILL